MLIFSWLVWAQRTRADELSTEFLTQWCQTRDCDVQLAQVNSGAPAGNTQTQTQTDCYQVWVVISVFGSANLPYIVSLKRLSETWHMEPTGNAEAIWKWQCC